MSRASPGAWSSSSRIERRSASKPTGRWAQRYGELGGGLNEVDVHTDDGRTGTAIYELTGAHHHRYFPIPRAERLPPNG